jgi:hypothetical protein
MTEYRRTRNITDIDWWTVFSAYEALRADDEARIDGAVEQGWFDENRREIGRRLGACWVYDNKTGFMGRPMFRDQILAELGIYLGYEEVEG